MKITQNRIITEEIHLTEDTVNKVAIDRLCQMLNGGEYLRTDNEKVYLKQDDPDWRHGSVSEVIVREATELDIAVFKVLDELRKKK